MARSGVPGVVQSTDAESELLPVSDGSSGELTVATLSIVEQAWLLRVAVTVMGGRLAPLASGPACVQVITVEPLHDQPLPEAVAPVSWGGTLSVTVIGPASVPGPSLETLSV